MAKVKKAQDGARVKGTMVGRGARSSSYSVDTTGYSAGKKSFPATIKTTVGTKEKKEMPEEKGTASRSMVKDFIKGKTSYATERQKSGGKTVPKKAYGGMMMKKGGKMKKSK